jgi:hypothetical protein
VRKCSSFEKFPIRTYHSLSEGMLVCNSKVSGILFDPARDPASSKLRARGQPRNETGKNAK